jgi:transcriptional regulator with XRE-family HTH domain
MAAKPKSRGYVKEWLQLADLKQSDLVRLLGYSKAKANAIWHGEQRLNEDILDELAPLANARPYELLMQPETAMRFRRLEAALRDVSQTDKPDPQAPENTPHHHIRKAG